MNKFIHEEIKPVWDEIDVEIQKTSEILKENSYSKEIIDSISLVVGELLENGIKHGTFKDANQLISYDLTIQDSTITVEVKNPIDENENDNLERLDKTIQWIRGHQNPYEAYVKRIKEVSTKALSDNESGLGLVRIAYEAQSLLDFYINENNTIAVSAVYQI